MRARLLLPSIVLTAGALAQAEPPRGAALFKTRCGICHAVNAGDTASGYGPVLGGILGRKAASRSDFSYSKALRASGLTWTRATLDAFLAAPAQLVPGTRMAVATPDADDRRAILEYLAKSPKQSQSTQASPRTENAPPAAAQTGDWAGASEPPDGPGVRHRVAPADLPSPFATRSVRNSPRVVDQPPGAHLSVPAGFTINLFAKDLDNPRLVRVAPNGDIFVAESNLGQLIVFRTKDGAVAPERKSTFATGLSQPFGIAFYPPGPAPRFVYVANTDSVVRFPYESGDLLARGPAETIVPRLTRSRGGGHWTRDVVFSADGRQMFVSVGSASNVAEGMDKWPVAKAQAFEAKAGLGAAWGDEEGRADVRVFDPEGKGDRVFAAGIRNCVGLAFSPRGELWCSTNERDGLGDELVPDYLTHVQEGAFYGWPWFYLGDHADPRHAGERPDLAGKITVPDVLVQSHSASLEMVFYDGTLFPPEYRGDAFAAFHGSWNRAKRTGYKVVRVRFRDGQPTGDYEDFMTGFVTPESNVWGRPVGVAVAHDGALLVTEDGNGTVWRIGRSP